MHGGAWRWLGACGLLAGCALAAAQDLAWRGAGWYQVLETGRGPRLVAGPYKTELACKKAMNASTPALGCRELPSAPKAR